MGVLNRFPLALLTLILAGCSGELVEYQVRSDGRIDKRRVMARDEIPVPNNSGDYSLRTGSTTIAYQLPRPLAFMKPPVMAPVLRPGEVQEVFSAYYETTGWPTETARYEVAAAVARLENPSPTLDLGSKNAVLKGFRSVKSLKSLPIEESIRTEVWADNRWTVFREYDNQDRALLDRIIFARLIQGGEYLVFFRLNFWSGAKGAEWRASRMRLIEEIVKSVRFGTAQRSNQAMQRTAGRSAVELSMTSTFNQQRRAFPPAVADLVFR